ncbi:MAG: hypothetical protein ABIK09_00760 [Pseudomonadota bacterium]
MAAPAAAGDDKKDAGEKDAEAEVTVAEPVWPSPLDPGKYDQIYALLPFGKDRGEFFTVLRQRFEQLLRPVLKATLEPHQRDVLKAQLDRDFDAVEKTWTEFSGQDTGYTVSVIADEFRQNASEAVVKYMYGENAAYFLFTGGDLWQVQLCVEPQTPFDALVKRLEGLYEQPPAELAWDNPDDKEGLLGATWRDTIFELTVRAPRGLFRCNTIRWVYLPAQDGITIRRDAAVALHKGDSTAQDLLNQVTGEGGGDVDNVLDKVLDNK